jgi:hypothetical protein
MSERQTVLIKGVLYDVATGAPVKTAPHTPHAEHTHTIRKFAPHQDIMPRPTMKDIAPVHHPMAMKAHAKQAAAKQVRTVKPSQVIKQEAIAEAMQKAPERPRTPVKVRRKLSKGQRALRITTAGTAVLLLASYLTYLNMPALSTRIAALQSGINATYPTYTPSGYKLAEPVAYKNGMIAVKFTANAGPQEYNITEERSTWDSTAVRENYIQPQVGDKYVTTQANGLTIYTYGQNAAWVNGGILYTISGNAPLSSDQVQRIAISM